ncbi:tyrosinase [Phlegmacium glaucopus]|nr:tyrosinase [Phlegmacium glaucopus]
MSRFVITGAGGGSPNRLEINDLVKDEKLFSLYIQALLVMQTKQSQSNIQTFFQVAGIHGLPYIVWDGATGNPDGPWGGYCTHGSVLFPTWHRPYVMLYEQILQQRAKEIAATYTVDKESWQQAANNLRQPFWDWARNSTPPDEVIALKQVTITGHDGKHIKVDNPLYHYKFHPIDPSFPDPYSGWQTTLRQPTSLDPDATDDVNMLRNVLASAQTNITSSTYNMLTRVHTWPAFSNHTVGDGGSTSNSVEAIHDGIHVDVGGNGQMADPSVAGFDPIFFLHHANVDRMLSLWSALNPTVWVSAGDSEDGSFTIPPGVTVDQSTALTPFWDDQTSFWASAAVTDTSKLGYTYPDFNGLDMGNPDAVKTAIGNLVNQLYGSPIFGAFAAVPPASVPAAVSVADKSRGIPAPSVSHHAPAPQQHVLSTQVTDHSQGHAHIHVHHSIAHPIGYGHGQPLAPPNRGLWDWTARIEFKKYELGSSFSVLFFLGTVPENPYEWRISPNYVGATHAFVNSAAAQCGNCRNQQDVVQEGFVHLNHAIAQYSRLGTFEPDVIEPYLIKSLHWRVQKSNGDVVQLESLEVTVIATALSYPPGSIFPVPGHAHRHNQITYGRTGGSRHA